MIDTKKITVDEFLSKEVSKLENRLFWAKIISVTIAYVLITWFLNSIRSTASLWVVWPLIIIQFALYFSIFVSAYNRSKVLGLNKALALLIFVIAAILGRVNNLELVFISIVVAVMLIFSAQNKKVSKRGQLMYKLPGEENSVNNPNT
ncbi:MAG: hypothetical protein WCO09_00890 [bacterium]